MKAPTSTLLQNAILAFVGAILWHWAFLYIRPTSIVGGITIILGQVASLPFAAAGVHVAAIENQGARYLAIFFVWTLAMFVPLLALISWARWAVQKRGSALGFLLFFALGSTVLLIWLDATALRAPDTASVKGSVEDED